MFRKSILHSQREHNINTRREKIFCTGLQKLCNANKYKSRAPKSIYLDPAWICNCANVNVRWKKILRENFFLYSSVRFLFQLKHSAVSTDRLFGRELHVLFVASGVFSLDELPLFFWSIETAFWNETFQREHVQIKGTKMLISNCLSLGFIDYNFCSFVSQVSLAYDRMNNFARDSWRKFSQRNGFTRNL